MTNNGPLPQLTKKHNKSSSLWSSLPVTALLRGQQNEKKESFLSAAQHDQDEEREREKEDFLLAAQGPNLLLLPWDGGEPYERLQVQEQSAKCKIANMDNIYCLCLRLWCYVVLVFSIFRVTFLPTTGQSIFRFSIPMQSMVSSGWGRGLCL